VQPVQGRKMNPERQCVARRFAAQYRQASSLMRGPQYARKEVMHGSADARAHRRPARASAQSLRR